MGPALRASYAGSGPAAGYRRTRTVRVVALPRVGSTRTVTRSSERSFALPAHVSRRFAVVARPGRSVTSPFASTAPPDRTSSLPRPGIDDATVTVDDQLLGTVGFVEKKGVALPPGKHRITIEKAGYFPYDELVVVKEGDPPVSLKVQLEAVPD